MTELTDELLDDARGRMSKSVASTNNEFGSVRTGRASPAAQNVGANSRGRGRPLREHRRRMVSLAGLRDDAERVRDPEQRDTYRHRGFPVGARRIIRRD